LTKKIEIIKEMRRKSKMRGYRPLRTFGKEFRKREYFALGFMRK
jgi:hypothetical protein